jgi:multidrug efflux pump subunit AcrA (membrane-fusion protein)
MKTKTLILLLCVLAFGIVLGAIGRQYYSSLPPAASAPPDQVHDHAHGEGNAQITVWSERIEIFLEHPLLAVNEPAEFVTHVSDLVTLEPRRRGLVTFMLRFGSDSPIEHIEPKPARDGIYIPELTFPKAGDWVVSVVVLVDGEDHVVELPPVKVYASHAELDNAPAPEEIEGIGFLKEQQWKIPSKTELVQVRQTPNGPRVAVPESAVVDEGAEKIAFVQLAGETFAERALELGTRADGFVQVLSGLSEGDRVVTVGAAAIAEAEHAAAADVHDHGSDPVVHLSADDVKRYAIKIGRAGPGEVGVHVSLPGQIVINSDRVAHIMPNAAGVVRTVLKNVGDTVKAGEIIAWLESSELGKAKVDYLTKWSELTCCSMDLTRAQQIFDSTAGLLEKLKASPSLETIRQVSGEALDANHTQLVSAYAELVLAGSAYEREKSLYEKKISSEKDYLAAENEFKKADAKYAAARDSIAFGVKRSLLEAQRDRQVREIELKGAERNLYVLGLSADDISAIQLFEVQVCDDPNCPECVAQRAAQAGQSTPAKQVAEKLNEVRLIAMEQTPDGGDKQGTSEPLCDCPECIAKRAAQAADAEALAALLAAQKSQQQAKRPHTHDEQLAWYPLRAPFDATVIEKHITLGEKLSDETSAFTVADLSTVWVDLGVFQNDLPRVRPGQPVTVSIGPSGAKVTGTISYVGPIVGEKTRTALARVVLGNASGRLRPGTFVTADVLVDKVAAKVAVAKDVVQDMDDRPTVFVWTGHAFEPRTVSLGRVNGTVVEITSGLEPGDMIVTKNGFRLKAELQKDAGGGHAGHGHAH